MVNDMKDNREGTVTRREFLKCSGGVIGACVAGSVCGGSIESARAASRPWVISVRNAEATFWDHSSGYHWDFIRQNVVSNMVATGVKALTGADSELTAWRQLIPYSSGEAVAIKINLNNFWNCVNSNVMDAYPETVNSVVKALIQIGVPAEKIWVTDPSRPIPARFINRISYKNILFFSSIPGCDASYALTDYADVGSSASSATTYPPGDKVRPAQVLVDAAHIINIPLFKGHYGAGITLGLKNHYGSVTFSGNNQYTERSRMHAYLYESENPDPSKSIVADINNNHHIKLKTRLIIGDGLFGHPFNNGSEPIRWEIFQYSDPNILFFKMTPLPRIQSCVTTSIRKERHWACLRPFIHAFTTARH